MRRCNNFFYSALTVLAVLCCVLSANRASAQTVALRTNALLWGCEAANISIDLTANECSTIGVTGVFSMSDSWLHDTHVNGLQLEYRYWFSHQPFHSMFVGPVAGLLHYTVDDDAHTQLAVPAGLQAGYAWTLSRHWNIEALYGVGYMYYERAYEAADKVRVHHRHKFTTINLGLNVSYIF